MLRNKYNVNSNSEFSIRRKSLRKSEKENLERLELPEAMQEIFNQKEVSCNCVFNYILQICF